MSEHVNGRSSREVWSGWTMSRVIQAVNGEYLAQILVHDPQTGLRWESLFTGENAARYQTMHDALNALGVVNEWP